MFDMDLKYCRFHCDVYCVILTNDNGIYEITNTKYN